MKKMIRIINILEVIKSKFLLKKKIINIFFYNINDDKNIFYMIFITKIKINKEDPYFSECPFNSCVIKDKYLLVETKVDKVGNNNNNIINDIKIIKAGIY